MNSPVQKDHRAERTQEEDNRERQVNEYAVNEHKAVMMRRSAISKEAAHISAPYDAAACLKKQSKEEEKSNCFYNNGVWQKKL